MKPLLSLVIILLILLPSASSFAQQQEQKTRIKVTKLTERVYVLTHYDENGYGLNSGLVVGENGLVVINSLMPSHSQAHEKAIRAISDKPIRYVFNSNADPYNHKANKYWIKRGAIAVGHQNLHYYNVDSQLLFDSHLSIDIGNEQIEAFSSSAHSPSHINIKVVKDNVIFVADSYRNDWMTILGPNGLQGYLNGVADVLARANKHTQIVPGNTMSHVVSSVEDLRGEIALRKTFAKRVEQLYLAGVNAETIAKDKKLVGLLKNHYPEVQHSSKYLIEELILTDLLADYALSQEKLSAIPGLFGDPTNPVELFYDGTDLFLRQIKRTMFKLKAIDETTFRLVGEGNGGTVALTYNSEGLIDGIQIKIAKDTWWSGVFPPGVLKRLTAASDVL